LLSLHCDISVFGTYTVLVLVHTTRGCRWVVFALWQPAVIIRRDG